MRHRARTAQTGPQSVPEDPSGPLPDEGALNASLCVLGGERAGRAAKTPGADVLLTAPLDIDHGTANRPPNHIFGVVKAGGEVQRLGPNAGRGPECGAGRCWPCGIVVVRLVVGTAAESWFGVFVGI
jgi:hypothetical protein